MTRVVCGRIKYNIKIITAYKSLWRLDLKCAEAQ